MTVSIEQVNLLMPTSSSMKKQLKEQKDGVKNPEMIRYRMVMQNSFTCSPSFISIMLRLISAQNPRLLFSSSSSSYSRLTLSQVALMAMTKPMIDEKAKQCLGSQLSVKNAPMKEPISPPQDIHVHEKALSSSLPSSGYLLAWMTIMESTMTSEKAMVKFEIKSIQHAALTDSKPGIESTNIVMTCRTAAIRRQDLRREPQIGMLSEMSPQRSFIDQGR